jgi:hypothetical protein
MRNETDADDAEVSDCMRSLGSLPGNTPLPDPDVLWLRARIAARQEAVAKALWRSIVRRVLFYGLVCAGAAWLMLDSALWQGAGLVAWDEAYARLSADPVLTAAISSAVALGTAFLIAASVFGRSLVARRLRYLGLL